MSLGLATGVVVIVYLIIELLKHTIAKTDRQQDYLPIAGVLIGIVIAVCIFFFDQSMSLGIYVGDNAFIAILTGAGSGLVATGGNQLFKKINKLLSGDYEGISEGLDEVLDDVKDILDDQNIEDSETKDS